MRKSERAKHGCRHENRLRGTGLLHSTLMRHLRMQVLTNIRAGVYTVANTGVPPREY